MNKLKLIGAGVLAGGGLTKNDWLFILSIMITVLGMLQSYWENRD